MIIQFLINDQRLWSDIDKRIFRMLKDEVAIRDFLFLNIFRLGRLFIFDRWHLLTNYCTHGYYLFCNRVFPRNCSILPFTQLYGLILNRILRCCYNAIKIISTYRVCRGFRLMNQGDYFKVNFDHF